MRNKEKYHTDADGRLWVYWTEEEWFEEKQLVSLDKPYSYETIKLKPSRIDKDVRD
jgi:hypothetical protein